MEKFYQTMLNTIHNSPHLKKIIIALCHILPLITFCLYPCLLVYLFIKQSPLLLSTLFKPMIAFVLVSLLRKIINRKRPYESMDIEPLLEHKKGESFPSRHSVSAFIIAFVTLPIHTTLGILALIVAIMIGISRIVAGVHYVSDVVVSVIIAYVIYLI